MPWTPDVPFPAENLSRCRGCDQVIGWIRKAEDDRPHSVQPRGWAGREVFESAPGQRLGYTREGSLARVVEPPRGMKYSEMTVVFESHFAMCPKADHYRRAARERARRYE